MRTFLGRTVALVIGAGVVATAIAGFATATHASTSASEGCRPYTETRAMAHDDIDVTVYPCRPASGAAAIHGWPARVADRIWLNRTDDPNGGPVVDHLGEGRNVDVTERVWYGVPTWWQTCVQALGDPRPSCTSWHFG